MNKVILMGRLTRDPEVRSSQGETPLAIARYTLAVDRRGTRNNGGDDQSADFIGCVAFGRAGEFAERYLRKGTKIAVTGRIQTGSYTNKDGVKVYTTDVMNSLKVRMRHPVTKVASLTMAILITVIPTMDSPMAAATTDLHPAEQEMAS